MPPKKYSSYTSALCNHKKHVRCKTCGETALPKDLAKHLHQVHGVDKNACPWCLGRVSWPDKQKTRNAQHLFDCFRKYNRVVKTPKPPTLPITTILGYLFSMVAMCRPRNLLGRTKLFPDYYYEDAFSLPDDYVSHPNQLQFQGNVGLGIRYVRMFDSLKEYEPGWFQGTTHGWFHVMVTAAAYDSFLRVLKDRIYALPFWCWCDGGGPKDPQYRHHRHMIVLAPDKKQFLKDWAKVKRGKGSHCKIQKVIQTSYHLIHAIQYVSRTRSNCNKASPSSQPGQHHYYIATDLPKYFALSACTQTKDNGLLKYITNKYGKCAVLPLFKHCVYKNHQYRVPIRHVIQHPDLLRVVLPVVPHFRPVRIDPHDSDAYMHLVGRLKLHFEYDPSLPNLPFSEWVQLQGDLGNRFLDVVKDSLWPLSKPQRAKLKELDKMHRAHQTHTQQWEARLAEKDLQLQTLEARLTKVTTKKNRHLQRLLQLETERDDLRKERDYLKNDQIARLEKEIESLRQTLAERDRTITFLTRLARHVVPRHKIFSS